MRLLSFQTGGQDSWGAFAADGTIADAGAEFRSTLPTMRAYLEADDAAKAKVAEFVGASSGGLAESDISYLEPVTDPGKVICVGLNYRKHAAETNNPIPSHPLLFPRWTESHVPHDVPLIIPQESERFDFEGELAVVIGKLARRVSEADALNYVAGYSCYNDGSIRDWQRHTTQYLPGKNFFKSGSFGPVLVTADEIPDPSALKLETRLNGEVVQQEGVDDLIFNVPQLINYISTFTELRPGDVIVTGTPSGVGAARTPQLWMKPGDTVEVDISQIGVLRNQIELG